MSENDTEVAEKDNDQPETIDLYDANKGLLKRTGGPYLDELERVEAEKRRALVEDREPDLEHPPASVGTLLVPKQYLRETDTDHSAAALGGYVELEHEPEGVLTVQVDTDEVDPTQVDWDNDHQKVNAMQAAAAHNKAQNTVNTPDVEPEDEFSNNKSWNVPE